jgi:broad specificity phosphatase PhoE
MKQIVVLRHANWHGKDILTEAGAAACTAISASIGPFDLVLSSPTNRTQQTAILLSGQTPRIEVDANVPSFSEEQTKIISERRPSNPLGIVGVIREEEGLIATATAAGGHLVSLILRSFDQLNDNQRALIVTHDGTMAAAEQILMKESFEKIDHSYLELEGYIVNDDLRVQRFLPHS